MTADLVDFLRARLADDERTAQAAVQGQWKLWGMQVLADPVGDSNVATAIPIADTHSDPPRPLRTWNADHIIRHDPARVLREVAAKRRLLEYAEGGTCGFSDNGGCLHCDYLGILAAVYADHPEYRDEWAI